MATAEKLRECIAGVEALSVSATDPRDRDATANVLRRLRARLAEEQPSEDGRSIPTGKLTFLKKQSTSNAEGQQNQRQGDARDKQDGNSVRMSFWFSDEWTRCLLRALAEHHGLKYHRKRERGQTVVLEGPKHVLNEEFAVRFRGLGVDLSDHLARMTRWVIAEKIGKFDRRAWSRWRRF
jgi:hypothetical protein